MKNFFLGVVVAIIGAGIYLFYVNDFTFEVRITEQQIESTMEPYYPFSENVIELFEVTYLAPDFQLQEGSDRANLEMEIRVRIRALPGPARYRTTVQVESDLRYDHETRALYLSDSEVTLAQISGLNDNYWGRLRGVLGGLIEQYLDKNPIYEFDVAQMEADGLWNKTLIGIMGVAVKDIRVENGRLVARLGI